MTDTIRIDSGVKRLQIQLDDGESCELVFNPTETSFRERFQNIGYEIKAKMEELSREALELDKKRKATKDESITKEIDKRANEMSSEICTFARGKLDELFGEGTSQKLFGDLMSEFAIMSFLEQIGPYINLEKKIKKYIKK